MKPKTTTDRATARPWHHFPKGIISDRAGTVRIVQMIPCDDENTATALADLDLIVKAVNERDALVAVAEAVKAMKHDINIFYAKYREQNNHYIADLDKALSTLNTLRNQTTERKK